ncbi:MAG: coproporphyrinogen III oxidase family protein, partial [Bacteroidota bacterium]|nr:coproporphyrinogen III oxidase family protein [Bacteroidota bacterium]
GADCLRNLRILGVDRLSIGVQSFDDGMLRWMNRRHDAAGAEKAFTLAREAGFDNISIDLIFGLSNLPDEIWAATVEKAVELRPEHISCYQLTVEGESALAAMVADGRYREADEEQCHRQYDILCEKLRKAGYHHYEISNFAQPGYEARHNSGYWRREAYIGLGPAAHSFRGNTRYWNSNSLSGYTVSEERLSDDAVRIETIMLSLRTAEGINRDWLEAHCEAATVASLLEKGALALSEQGRIRIPEDRFFVSDEIIRELI